MDLFLFWVACERVAGLLSRPCRSDRFSRSCCRIARGFFRRYVGVFFHGVPTKKGGSAGAYTSLAWQAEGSHGLVAAPARKPQNTNRSRMLVAFLMLASWARERCPTGLSVYQIITKAAWQRDPHTHTHTHTHTASWLRCTEM